MEPFQFIITCRRGNVDFFCWWVLGVSMKTNIMKVSTSFTKEWDHVQESHSSSRQYWASCLQCDKRKYSTKEVRNFTVSTIQSRSIASKFNINQQIFPYLVVGTTVAQLAPMSMASHQTLGGELVGVQTFRASRFGEELRLDGHLRDALLDEELLHLFHDFIVDLEQKILVIQLRMNSKQINNDKRRKCKKYYRKWIDNNL